MYNTEGKEKFKMHDRSPLNTSNGHREKVAPAPSKGNRIHPPETSEAHLSKLASYLFNSLHRNEAYK